MSLEVTDENPESEKENNGQNPGQDNAAISRQIEALNQKLLELQLEKETAPQKTQGLTKDDIMLLGKVFAESIKESNKKELDFEAGVDESQLEPGDWDEKGVRFCCPRVLYVITDDKRKGKRVTIPNNKKVIFFNHIGTRIIEQGKYNSTAPICAYRSHSKKEIAWLKEHALFNVEFYENANAVKSIDSTRILRMTNIMQVLKNLELPDLMKMCAGNDVPQTPEDPAVMRFELATKIVNKEMNLEQARTVLTMEEAYKADLLLKV